MLRLFFSLVLVSLSLWSAPTTSWYLDELGRSSYSYTIDDIEGNNEGTTYATPSTGVSSGKICSALDFRTSSVLDYAVLDKDALHGSGDFTISMWTKQSSKNGKSLLSGARSGQKNELILWFSSDTRVYGYLNGASNGGITVPSISDNTWHHIVWRRSGTQSCFFTDGVKRGCVTVTNKVLAIDSLILAQEQDSVGGAFDAGQDWEGLVDEFLIFKNQALSDASILSIYNNQNAGKTWNGGTRTCETLSMDGYTDWHFDEASWNGSPNEIVDSHGNNHGRGFNVPTVAGKLCNAIDLRANGTSDYVKLGENSADILGDFTISVWHKGEAGTDSNALLSGAKSGEDNELLFWMSNSTSFVPHLNGSTQTIVSNNINNGTWQHLVWRRFGHENCFFQNGIKKTCVDRGSFSPLQISSLILGQDQDNVGGAFSSSQDWEGILDELLIFRRAFTDNEINSIYTNQNSSKNWDGGVRTCTSTLMNISKNSCVITDLINGTSNPKRIPGATIRYAFEVNNRGNGDATNVLLKETIKSQFDETSIVNLKIDNSHECNCLTPTSVSNNGANGGISGSNTTLDFGTVSALSVECGYFEVKLK